MGGGGGLEVNLVRGRVRRGAGGGGGEGSGVTRADGTDGEGLGETVGGRAPEPCSEEVGADMLVCGCKPPRIRGPPRACGIARVLGAGGGSGVCFNGLRRVCTPVGCV